MNTSRRVWQCVGLLLLVTSCRDRAESNRAMPTRPVTVMELQGRELPIERALTGAVSLYREEQIGFEVGGRVLAVEDVGK